MISLNKKGRISVLFLYVQLKIYLIVAPITFAFTLADCLQKPIL
jgi:hypothetical protein